MSEIECTHDNDDPLCTCHLERMIETNKKLRKIADLFWDDEEWLRQSYFSNPVTKKLVDVLYDLYKE